MPARDSRSDISQTNETVGNGGPAEAASFISEAVTELAQLSQRHGLDMLTHLLEMAQLEADEFVQRHINPGHF